MEMMILTAVCMVMISAVAGSVAAGYKDNVTANIHTALADLPSVTPGSVKPAPVVNIQTPILRPVVNTFTGQGRPSYYRRPDVGVGVGVGVATTQRPLTPATTPHYQAGASGARVMSALVSACQDLHKLVSQSPTAHQLMQQALPSVPTWLYGPTARNQCPAGMYSETIRAFTTTCALLTTCRMPTINYMPMSVVNAARPQFNAAVAQPVFVPLTMRAVLLRKPATWRQNVPFTPVRNSVWKQILQMSVARGMFNRQSSQGTGRTAGSDSTKADPDNGD